MFTISYPYKTKKYNKEKATKRANYQQIQRQTNPFEQKHNY